MKTNPSKILFCAVVLFIQIVLSDFVNIGPYVYLCTVPMLVIYLSMDQDSIVSMLLALGFGLAVDALEDGVLGLNAVSAVALAAVRKPLFTIFFSKENLNRAVIPSIQEVGIFKHINYILCSLVVYFVVYIFFDSIGLESFSTSLLRLVFSCAANLLLILGLDYFLLNTRR